MKKITLLILPLATLFAFKLSEKKLHNKSTYHHTSTKNASGSPTGRSGAPGETNCTACHAGSSQSGTNENIFKVLDNNMNVVSSYVPGNSYTIQLSMNSNPTKKGFQATALNSSNNMAGNFVGQAGNTTISGNTRKYANHNSSSNTSSVPTWNWTWTAPATDQGEVTFYVATNKADNNQQSSGDIIYVSQHKLNSTLNIEEKQNYSSIQFLGYNTEKHTLTLDMNNNHSGEMVLNIVDLNGKSVFFSALGNAKVGKVNKQIALPESMPNGIFIAHVFIDNNAYSSKVRIQR